MVDAVVRVLVLGGKGFIGRHAVRHLENSGVKVTIGTRNPSTDGNIEQQKFRLEELPDAKDWKEIVEKYDAVLNCVGILRQRFGESYEVIHHHAPKAIAKACSETGTRFVHVSALGLSPTAKSRFLLSKHRGEVGIMESACDWVIVRPSLLDGEGGFGAGWLRGVAKLPIFVVPTSAKGRISALSVDDAGEALAKLCTANRNDVGIDKSRIFELGGEHPLNFEDYIRALRRRYSDKEAKCLTIPGWLARFVAHVFDLIHFSPFSFGHWELLCKDNVPSENRLASLLKESIKNVV